MPARIGGRRPLAELRQSTAGLDAAIAELKKLGGLREKLAFRIETAAPARLAAPVRAMLLANLAASGIGSRTNKLRNAVARAQVNVTLKASGQGLITIRFPAGVSKKSQNPAAYGSILHHGAVYAPRVLRDVLDIPTQTVKRREVRSILGARAKKSLKRARFGGKQLTKNEKKFIRQTFAQYGQLGQSIRFLPPRPFFDLNPSQVASLQSLFLDIVQAELDSLFAAAA